NGAQHDTHQRGCNERVDRLECARAAADFGVHAAASWKDGLSTSCRRLNTGHCSGPRRNAPARYRSQRTTVGGASPANSDSEKRRKPSTSSTNNPAGTSRWLTTMTRTLRVLGVTPEPRYCRRSRMGSSWPRTLAMPFTQVLAPGTRV